MSYDLAFWKRRRWRRKLSDGLCYLLVSEGLECEALEILDQDAISAEIEEAFPELTDPDSDGPNLELSVLPQAILLSATGSTPDEVLGWFEQLAQQRSLSIFDPQQEDISQADLDELRRRQAVLRAGEEERMAAAELPGLQAGAESSDPRAIVQLGVKYSLGEGVEQDHRRAFELYERAALAGHPDGMFNLASCYRLGEGVGKDPLEAIRWYRRAYDAGEYFAPFVLGEIFAEGEGVPADRRRAIRFFEIAESRGHQDARR